MIKIYNFLLENGFINRRDPDEQVSLKSNYVPYMYLFLPDKEEVLRYKTGKGPFPGRYLNTLSVFILQNMTRVEYITMKESLEVWLFNSQFQSR